MQDVGAGLVPDERNARDFRPVRYSAVKGDATREFEDNGHSA